MVIFTADPEAVVNLTITPATVPFSGELIEDELDVEIETVGSWLLVVSGRWSGDVSGDLSPAGAQSSLPIGKDAENFLDVDGRLLRTTWLLPSDLRQYVGVGAQRLTFRLDQPYLYDRLGHRNTIYAPAGCATFLPSALTLATNTASTGIAGWHVPASCSVVVEPIQWRDDYVESYSRNPTLLPNQPGWGANATRESSGSLATWLASMWESATVRHADGTLEGPLFLSDRETGLGGRRDMSALTMPAQHWKADSDSVAGRASMWQAVSITGFGAAGALAASVLLAAVRLLLGQTAWLRTRYVVPGLNRSSLPERAGPSSD